MFAGGFLLIGAAGGGFLWALAGRSAALSTGWAMMVRWAGFASVISSQVIGEGPGSLGIGSPHRRSGAIIPRIAVDVAALSAPTRPHSVRTLQLNKAVGGWTSVVKTSKGLLCGDRASYVHQCRPAQCGRTLRGFAGAHFCVCSDCVGPALRGQWKQRAGD